MRALLKALAPNRGEGPGIELTPLDAKRTDESIEYKHVTVTIDQDSRHAEIILPALLARELDP